MFESFGVGYVYAVPVGGNTPTDKTPVKLMGLQEVSFNRTAKMVPLKGSQQFPDAVAVSDKEVKGKAKMARVDGEAFNQIMFGENPATNAPIIYYDEGHTIPASTPFTVTVTNASTFTKDLGVRLGNGQPLVNLQGASLVAGGYNVAAGVYTFHTSAAGQTVQISYQGTSTAGTVYGEHNQVQGWAPILQMVLWEPYASTLNLSNNNGFIFYNVIFGGMNVPIKRDDWVYPDLEWEAFADPNTIDPVTGKQAVWAVIDGAGTGI